MGRFRRIAASVGAAALLTAPALALGASRSAPTTARPATPAAARPLLDDQIVGEINRVRADHHLSLLRTANGLTASAAAHSREMIDHGFFAHESPGDGAFWRRIDQYYADDSFRRWFVGETILWASPDVDARTAVQDWLNSPPHRRILLDRGWRELGVSALHAKTAPGAFEGLDATIITADFGVRAR
jgi:uncharacterized protein YkwD